MTNSIKRILGSEATKQMAKINGVSEQFVKDQIEAKNPKAIKQFAKLFTLALLKYESMGLA